nr:beta-expansin [Bothriochloa pertusa]
MASSSARRQAQLAAVAVLLSAMVGRALCEIGDKPGPNITATYNEEWQDAKATFYGSNPRGAAPDDDGGACGYKNVDKAPFFGMTGCGNEPIFKDGLGCGSCFEIKCKEPAECSDKPVLIRITDKNYEHIAAYHFDLSGKAFGSMAKQGQEDNLRKAGELTLQFRRVKCEYPSKTKITFHVEKGCNDNYLALLVEYAAGDGDIVAVDIKPKGSDEFLPMKPSWGAIWRIDPKKPLKGPFTVRLTSESGAKLVQEDVIPADWKPNTAYTSNLQY